MAVNSLLAKITLLEKTCQLDAPETVWGTGCRRFYQDTFDHDKGQKSAISGRRLHWRLSTGFFAFSPVFMCNLVRRAPYNLEKVAKNPVEKIASNPVTSVAVMVFSALIHNIEESLGESPRVLADPQTSQKRVSGVKRKR